MNRVRLDRLTRAAGGYDGHFAHSRGKDPNRPEIINPVRPEEGERIGVSGREEGIEFAAVESKVTQFHGREVGEGLGREIRVSNVLENRNDSLTWLSLWDALVCPLIDTAFPGASSA